MGFRLLITAALGALVLSPSVASAQESGWYLRGNVTGGQFLDSDIENSFLNQADVLNTTTLTNEADADFGGTLALGYDFSNNWRVEFDASTLWNDLGIDFIDEGHLDGGIRTNAFMINGIYDFDLNSRWAPYLGAGLGIVESSYSAFIPNAADRSNPKNDCLPNCNIRDEDIELGWQVLAGLGYDITDRLTWDTHYRFQYGGTPDINFVNQGTTPSGRELELADVASQSISTGLRYRFGGAAAAAAPVAALASLPAAPLATYSCWDGTIGYSEACCAPQPEPEPAPTYTCWDGAIVYDLAQCTPQPQPEPVQTYSCWDNSVVYDLAQCPAVPAPVAAYNNCGPSSVAIFNVDLTSSPKPLNRLGSLPEFGDSHNLTSTQFYEKLQARYAANQNGDRAYLNYLFRSMGYENGFRDAQPYMFSEETLPVGSTGVLGMGEQHNYGYYVLPNNDRDRQAFRIQSANGSVVHFMKTCGNYFYACN